MLKTSSDIRRENLILLRKTMGSTAELARRIDTSATIISQWINAAKDWKSGKPRQISDRSCRKIEKCLGLPEGWMDQDNAAGAERAPPENNKEPIRNMASGNLKVIALRAELARQVAKLMRESRMPISQLETATQINVDSLYSLATDADVAGLTLEHLIAVADALGQDVRVLISPKG